MSLINSTLPVSMKVLAKTSYNRYSLKIGTRTLQTKSLVELVIGGEYLAEIYQDKGGVLTFKNLVLKPNLAFYEQGLTLIVELLEKELDFKAFIIQSLSQASTKTSFNIYKEMLFASFEGVYHIPFMLENKACLFQLQKKAKSTVLYLYLAMFGALKFIFEEEGVQAYTSFSKVASFLQKEFPSFKWVVEKKVSPLFEFKKLLDFKG